MKAEKISLGDFKNLKVGHASSKKGITGCTVILPTKKCIAGVDIRGGSPGTIGTDSLDVLSTDYGLNGIVFTGGSSFGLNSVKGVMDYLEEQDTGLEVPNTVVPIVSGAVIFDLNIGHYDIRPNHEMGYQACLNASGKKTREGNIGAGMGATVGNLLGDELAMKGGFGAHFLKVGELKVGAMVVVNCAGNVINPRNKEVIAGCLKEEDTFAEPIEMVYKSREIFGKNTTLVCIVTNARMGSAEVTRLASVSHNGLSTTIDPSHLKVDGDTVFAISMRNINSDPDIVNRVAKECVEEAIISAIKNSESIEGFKSYKEIFTKWKRKA